MIQSPRLLVVLALVGAPLIVGPPAYAQDPPPLPAPPPPEPPPPAGYGPTGPPPGYSDQAPSPPAQAPPGTTAEIRFQTDQPGLRLLSLSGEAPYETIGWYGRGWYRRGWYGPFGWTPVYSAVCDQPCATRLAPGGYHLALAKYGGSAVPAPEPVIISGPSTIHGDYTDRSGLRTAGWIVGVAGAVGGLLLVVASAKSENVCDAYGDCYTHETASGPLLAAGVGVLLASAIVSTVLVFQRDEAHITVEPLTLPSIGATGRSPLADLGGVARPQGAALSLHF